MTKPRIGEKLAPSRAPALPKSQLGGQFAAQAIFTARSPDQAKHLRKTEHPRHVQPVIFRNGKQFIVTRRGKLHPI